jgi:superfamily I DNA and/or RNA helicase
VPDIIDFSNYLSCNGEIKVLRDPSTARQPHIIEYLVNPQLQSSRSAKTNQAEARVIAALIKAAIEQTEYIEKSIGTITLLGDEQAFLIQSLALQIIGAVELEKRRFLSGNSAQFQGDGRDIILLSMVDTSPKKPPLKMKAEHLFKQRYNVAVSRAKNQLWLVHSLDLNRDPRAKRKAFQKAAERAESHFEKEVIRRLISAGYQLQSQVWAGHYRINIVVSQGNHAAAIECDGDRSHPFEKIHEDMKRQAV